MCLVLSDISLKVHRSKYLLVWYWNSKVKCVFFIFYIFIFIIYNLWLANPMCILVNVELHHVVYMYIMIYLLWLYFSITNVYINVNILYRSRSEVNPVLLFWHEHFMNCDICLWYVMKNVLILTTFFLIYVIIWNIWNLVCTNLHLQDNICDFVLFVWTC